MEISRASSIAAWMARLVEGVSKEPTGQAVFDKQLAQRSLYAGVTLSLRPVDSLGATGVPSAGASSPGTG